MIFKSPPICTRSINKHLVRVSSYAHCNPKRRQNQGIRSYARTFGLGGKMGLKKGAMLISSQDRKLLKELGRRIKEMRNKKNLSVYDVTGEDLLIKSRQHWQKVEAGQLSLTFITLNKIAQALGVSVSDLVKNL